MTVPPLEISEDEGFSEDKDIFRRKGFGERLSNLIENTDGELVIALDAPWGEGKSTFVKMWRGHLKNKDNGIHTIYFDAFENDHQNAPFLALAGEIYNLIEESNEAEIFKDKTIAALKTSGRIGLRIGAKLLTLGVLDGTEFGDTTKKDISKEAVDVLDNYVGNMLKSASKDKAVVNEFRKYLEELPTKLGGKSIVFIIDELDRCKPPFALEIVEVVKHLFAVPNITFILVMNRTQLQASVEHEYGTGDPSKYLQKFINLWVSLPKSEEADRSHAKTYLFHCLKRMNLEAKSSNETEWNKMLEELVIYYNMSPREIERSLTNFAFIRMGLSHSFNYPYRWVTAYISVIKARYSDVYYRLSAGKIGQTGQIGYAYLIDKTDLTALRANWIPPGEKVIESHPLKWLLRYYMSDDAQKEKLLEAGNPIGAIELSHSRSVIEDTCRWLDSFRSEPS